MYIRMLYFESSVNKKQDMLTIMDNMIPKIKKQKGCKDCMFMMHEEDGHYALLVFWETKEHADAAAITIGPQILPALDKIVKEPVIPRLYEVYETASVLS